MMHTRRADPGLAVWLCAALLALPGCVSISVSAALGPRLSPQLLDLVVPGETTRAQVLEVLGPPEEYLRHEFLDSLGDDATRVSGAVRIGNRAQDVFTWQHDRFDARGRWWLLYLWIDTNVESDILMITFDERDMVREVAFRRATHE